MRYGVPEADLMRRLDLSVLKTANAIEEQVPVSGVVALHRGGYGSTYRGCRQ